MTNTLEFKNYQITQQNQHEPMNLTPVWTYMYQKQSLFQRIQQQ